MLQALPLALDILAEYLSTQQPGTHLKAHIVSPSTFAISKATDSSPHDEQDVTLQCLKKIGELMDAYPNINIELLWLPRSIPFVGFQRVKQLAFEAICMAVRRPEEEPHTIKHMEKKTKQDAIATWTERWHRMPHNSLAYKTALTRPPDGRPHPTFPTKEEPAKFSRTTSCTLYQLITGHAFIGAYTQRFYDQHTPEQVACPCGELVQTVEHLLLKCPNYAATHHKHLTANGRP